MSLTNAVSADGVQNNAPTGKVELYGKAVETWSLNVSVAAVKDLDGIDKSSLTYQWKVNGVEIKGATKANYVLTQAEVGKKISVVISYRDLKGNLETLESDQTSPVENINNSPTGSVIISGDLTQGAVLTASNTLQDEDGLGQITYTWYADGIVAGSGETLALTQAHVNKTIKVYANYIDGYGRATSVQAKAAKAIANVNDAPVGRVEISGEAAQGKILTVSNKLSDADGMGDVSYQWFADGKEIVGATGNKLELTQALVGAKITATATYVDGFKNTETVVSAETEQVKNVNDAPVGTVTISGDAKQYQTLTATNDLTDVDGLGEVGYQWFADGQEIVGANGAALTLDQALVGKKITVQASYTDKFGTKEAVSSNATAAVVNVNDAPTGSVVILGDAKQNEVLRAGHTLSDIDGLGQVSFQWFADGVAIEGATGNEFKLGQAQVGKAISVKASYVDGQGTAESVASSDTAKVENVNDAVQGSLRIEGLVKQNEVLKAVNDLSDLDGLGKITYTWFADGKEIAGENNAELKLTQSLVNKKISVNASYVDGFGSKESVTSISTAPVENVNDAPTGEVTVWGMAAQTWRLSALTSSLADLDGIDKSTIKYQWLANGENIAGANKAFLDLEQAQVGKNISVVVTYKDLQGTLETVKSKATKAIENVNDSPTGKVIISGEAKQGSVLKASNTLDDLDGMGVVKYVWYSDKGAIKTAVGDSLELTQDLVGKKIYVYATYTDGFGMYTSVRSSTTTAAVQNVNDAPVGTVEISGQAIEGEVLTASNTLSDVDGLGTISYQWLVNGEALAGASSATLELTQALVGKTISVKASYVDQFGAKEAVTSSATKAVANVNDAPVGQVTVSGDAVQGASLRVTNNLSDEDGIGSVSYQWLADGVAIDGANSEQLALTQSLVDKVISVKASYVDAYGTSEAVLSNLTSKVANVNDAPVGEVSISGSLVQGASLKASNTLSDLDGLGKLDYQWFADGKLVADANGDELSLTQALVGKSINVVASYVDGFGAKETVSSKTSAQVANVNDAPVGTVTITGEATQNSTLKANHDLSDLDGLGKIAYKWFANGVAIEGAEGSELTLTQAQVDKEITVTASYTDGFGANEAVSSKATAKVANVNDDPVSTLKITGALQQNKVLSVSGGVTDLDGVATKLSYQWMANGEILKGYNSDKIILTQAMVGKTISVVAQYVDGFQKTETVTVSTDGNVENVNDIAIGKTFIIGDVYVGAKVKAGNNLTDLDGMGVISYTWNLAGKSVGTGDELVITADMLGKKLNLSASYTDGFGTKESRGSQDYNVVKAPAAAPVEAASDIVEPFKLAHVASVDLVGQNHDIVLF